MNFKRLVSIAKPEQYKLLLLGAGNSKRFQGVKVIANVCKNGKDKPLVQHAVDSICDALTALSIPCSNLYLTTGIYHQAITEILNVNEGIKVYFSDKANQGMSYSLVQGMNQILKESSDTTHIMIALVDQIALTSDDYIQMLEHSFHHKDKIISAKTSFGLTAPVIFPRQYFEAILNLKGDVGAKSIVLAHSKQVETLLINNSEFDIDTQDDLIRWHEKSSK